MQPSIFNVRVPLPAHDEVFLMNTMTDAQLIVSSDVAALLDRYATEQPGAIADGEREAFDLLEDNGFLVADRASDRRNLDQYFTTIRRDTTQLGITVLTTLQCNFACDYCFQGDHGDYNKFAEKMTLETSGRVSQWIENELDRLGPEKMTLTFFGGEPLLNLPVMYDMAERVWNATQARGVVMSINIITNGLLLTPDVVDRLTPYGLKGVKITLDGDRDTHNRMRPLRGGQGTFDRIVENVRRVAGKVSIAIGGNFDESSVDSYPGAAGLPEGAGVRRQAGEGRRSSRSFAPDRRCRRVSSPLTPVGANGKPLNGTCMTSAGAGGTVCDTCNFADDKMSFLREETRRHGFPTADGVHMGPCQIHREHSHTIGPDGSLYACPGFTGELAQSTGHIDHRHGAVARGRAQAVRRDRRVEELRRLRFHPSLCRGMLGGVPHGAW